MKLIAKTLCGVSIDGAFSQENWRHADFGRLATSRSYSIEGKPATLRVQVELPANGFQQGAPRKAVL